MDLCDVSYCNIYNNIDVTRNFDHLDDIIKKQGLQLKNIFRTLALSALLILVCSAYPRLLHLLLVSIEPPDTQQ